MPTVDERKCVGCSYCQLACPKDAISALGGIAEIDASKCKRCKEVCVRFCPVGALIPEKAVRQKKSAHANKFFDVIVVGAGIGGLLTAAYLTKFGKKVLVLEKLPFLGGRCSSLDYRGFSIPTGAIIIPRSSQGVFGRIAKDLPLDLKLIDPKEPMWVWHEGRAVKYPTSFFDVLKVPRFWLPRAVSMSRFMRDELPSAGDDTSVGAIMADMVADDVSKGVVEVLCRLHTGLSAHDVPASEFHQMTLDWLKFGAQCLPEGGMGMIPKALAERMSERGVILSEREVTGIHIRKDRVVGISTSRGEKFFCDALVANIDPAGVARLIGREYFGALAKKLDKAMQVNMISLKIASDRPLFKPDGLMLVPGKRTAALCQTSVLDPSTAPRGKHLLQTWQPFPRNKGVSKEIQLGIEELHEIFPNFDRAGARPLVCTAYHKAWPGTFAGQTFGWVGNARFPFGLKTLKNLFLAGSSVKGRGAGIEYIARSVIWSLVENGKRFGISCEFGKPVWEALHSLPESRA